MISTTSGNIEDRIDLDISFHYLQSSTAGTGSRSQHRNVLIPKPRVLPPHVL
jgi:hypothetical protein